MFNLFVWVIAAANTLHEAPRKNSFGFSMQDGQADTVRRPMMTANASDTSKEYILLPGEHSSEKIRRNLFVKAIADKTECYVGEPVIVTYKLYSRLIAKSTISKQPALNGFSVYDMIDFISINETTELIQNRPFKVHILRKAQLIPLQAGTMQLDPIEIDNTVHFVRSSSPPALNGNSFQDLVNQISKEESAPSADVAVRVQSNPVEIVVKPFPESNRPAGFNGAVGSFRIRATITSKVLSVNDAGVLKVEIKGRGNVSLIDAPVINWPAGIDTLDMRVNEQVNKAVAPLSGIKTFEFVFTPLKAGRYSIPAILFSFFNPASHSYQTVQTQPNIFEVTAGNKPAIRKDIPGSSLSPLKNNYPFNTLIKYLKGQWGWIVTVTALLILSFYLWQKNRRFQKEKSGNIVFKVPGNNEMATQNTAEEQPTDMLLKSRALLDTGDYKGFYSELNNVLWNELRLKLNLSLADLNKQKVTQELRRRGWTHEMTNHLDTVLTKCERSIYLPDYRQETSGITLLESVQKLTVDLHNL